VKKKTPPGLQLLQPPPCLPTRPAPVPTHHTCAACLPPRPRGIGLEPCLPFHQTWPCIRGWQCRPALVSRHGQQALGPFTAWMRCMCGRGAS